MKPLYQQVNEALSHPDPSWGFYRVLTNYAANEMDRMLVRINHPLAMQPGTQWDRFRKLHAHGHQFTYLD